MYIFLDWIHEVEVFVLHIYGCAGIKIRFYCRPQANTRISLSRIYMHGKQKIRTHLILQSDMPTYDKGLCRLIKIAFARPSSTFSFVRRPQRGIKLLLAKNTNTGHLRDSSISEDNDYHGQPASLEGRPPPYILPPTSSITIVFGD